VALTPCPCAGHPILLLHVCTNKEGTPTSCPPLPPPSPFTDKAAATVPYFSATTTTMDSSPHRPTFFVRKFSRISGCGAARRVTGPASPSPKPPCVEVTPPPRSPFGELLHPHLLILFFMWWRDPMSVPLMQGSPELHLNLTADHHHRATSSSPVSRLPSPPLIADMSWWC
jgi:hypothetical protein